MDEGQARSVYNSLDNINKYVGSKATRLQAQSKSDEANKLVPLMNKIIAAQNEAVKFIPGAGPLGEIGAY